MVNLRAAGHRSNLAVSVVLLALAGASPVRGGEPYAPGRVGPLPETAPGHALSISAVVATVDIPAGARIRRPMVDSRAHPERHLPHGAALAIADVLDKVALERIFRNEIIDLHRLVDMPEKEPDPAPGAPSPHDAVTLSTTLPARLVPMVRKHRFVALAAVYDTADAPPGTVGARTARVLSPAAYVLAIPPAEPPGAADSGDPTVTLRVTLALRKAEARDLRDTVMRRNPVFHLLPIDATLPDLPLPDSVLPPPSKGFSFGRAAETTAGASR